MDTGGTLDNAVRLLKGAGARKIMAFATHGRFSGGGEERVAEIPDLDCLVICNTLPHRFVCFTIPQCGCRMCGSFKCLSVVQARENRRRIMMPPRWCRTRGCKWLPVVQAHEWLTKNSTSVLRVYAVGPGLTGHVQHTHTHSSLSHTREYRIDKCQKGSFSWFKLVATRTKP